MSKRNTILICFYILLAANAKLLSISSPEIITDSYIECDRSVASYTSNSLPEGYIANWQVFGGVLLSAADEYIEVLWSYRDIGGQILLTWTKTESGETKSTILDIDMVHIPEPQLLYGQYNVFPNSRHQYQTVNDSLDSYWLVSGGIILDSVYEAVTVEWGAVGTGHLYLIWTNPQYGCSDTTEYIVHISEAPGLVIYGPEESCRFREKEYTASLYDGAQYHWEAVGGELTEEADNGVKVRWDSSGACYINCKRTISELQQLDSASLPVIVHPIPHISWDSAKTICLDQGPTEFRTAKPEGGIYSGPYTYDELFDPSEFGLGAFPVYYAYIDSNYCSVSDTLVIYVRPVPDRPSVSYDGKYLRSTAYTGNQWYLNDSLLKGATHITYIPKHTGDYTVITTNEFGCSSAMSSAQYVYIDSISVEDTNPVHITVFPNPVGEYIIVETMDSDISSAVFRLYSISGRQILSRDLDNSLHKIDISGLPPGAYYYSIEYGKIRINNLLIINR